MLSDYIPVYWPGANQWSFPSYELEKYEDCILEPQDITLHKGHVVKGIPLVHFGTWGAVGVDVTGLLRKLVKEPSATCAECYKSAKTRAEVSAFFVELRKRYPEIENIEAMADHPVDGAPKIVEVYVCRSIVLESMRRYAPAGRLGMAL